MFQCQECGHKFKSVAAARKAAFGDSGCPGCGGSDIDIAPLSPTPRQVGRVLRARDREPRTDSLHPEGL